jgi:hypothetical protein
MKVVCVDVSRLGETPHLVPVRGLVVLGETYTVLRETERKCSWVLAEKPIVNTANPHVESGWLKHRFVPLDYYAAEFSVSETEPQEVTV